MAEERSCENCKKSSNVGGDLQWDKLRGLKVVLQQFHGLFVEAAEFQVVRW